MYCISSELGIPAMQSNCYEKLIVNWKSLTMPCKWSFHFQRRLSKMHGLLFTQTSEPSQRFCCSSSELASKVCEFLLNESLLSVECLEIQKERLSLKQCVTNEEQISLKAKNRALLYSNRGSSITYELPLFQ